MISGSIIITPVLRRQKKPHQDKTTKLGFLYTGHQMFVKTHLSKFEERIIPVWKIMSFCLEVKAGKEVTSSEKKVVMLTKAVCDIIR